MNNNKYTNAQRTINIYTYSGNLIATYKGKIDIIDSTDDYVKFDFNGKRYNYRNCTIEIITDSNLNN